MPHDVERVLKTGVRIPVSFGMVYTLSPTVDKGVHFWAVVGKRIDKRAVVRHTIQRRLREAMRGIVFSSTTTLHLAVVATNSRARTMDINDIRKEIEYAVSKTSLA